MAPVHCVQCTMSLPNKFKTALVHVHTAQCRVSNSDTLLYLNIEFYIALLALVCDAVDELGVL